MPSSVHELGLSFLLYVSRSCLHIDGDAQAINEIVEVSIARNRLLRVTGVLIYTQLHFAQILEGPSRSVSELMHSIERDARHRDVTVVTRHSITERKFSNWSMGYSGPSIYLDRHLKPLISPATPATVRSQLARELVAIMARSHAEASEGH